MSKNLNNDENSTFENAGNAGDEESLPAPQEEGLNSGDGNDSGGLPEWRIGQIEEERIEKERIEKRTFTDNLLARVTRRRLDEFNSNGAGYNNESSEIIEDEYVKQPAVTSESPNNGDPVGPTYETVIQPANNFVGGGVSANNFFPPTGASGDPTNRARPTIMNYSAAMAPVTRRPSATPRGIPTQPIPTVTFTPITPQLPLTPDQLKAQERHEEHIKNMQEQSAKFKKILNKNSDIIGNQNKAVIERAIRDSGGTDANGSPVEQYKPGGRNPNSPISDESRGLRDDDESDKENARIKREKLHAEKLSEIIKNHDKKQDPENGNSGGNPGASSGKNMGL